MSAEQVLLNRRQVETLTGIGRSLIYKLMPEGRFPKPVKVSTQAVRWKRAEVLDWINSRPKSDLGTA